MDGQMKVEDGLADKKNPELKYALSEFQKIMDFHRMLIGEPVMPELPIGKFDNPHLFEPETAKTLAKQIRELIGSDFTVEKLTELLGDEFKARAMYDYIINYTVE
jgi:hypothetical protein